MTAVVNTAALYFNQHEVAETDPSQAQKATIVAVYDGGMRVDVVVRKAGAVPQTPDAISTLRAVPFVEDGATPPVTGPFVTNADFTFPAPPQSGGSGGTGGTGS